MQADQQVQGGAPRRVSTEFPEPRSERDTGTDDADTSDARGLWERVTAIAKERAGGRVKLDIGAGAFPRGEDFIRVDPYFEIADVRAHGHAIPLPDSFADEIWSSHALEHVPCAKIHPTLKEWLRLLKPGCKAIVSVPNFDYVARYWLTGPDRTWAEQMVFGQQFNEGEFHKTAFTAATLRADMEAAGFEVLRVEMRWTHNQETLQAVAKKPVPKEVTHGEMEQVDVSGTPPAPATVQ